LLFAVLLASYGVQPVQGQTFNSGSTGADGALTFTTPGAYNFDPKALNIDPEHDNVFNFTTITIGSGVTLNLTSKVLSGPVYWLASGDVSITGTINLSGEDGVGPLTNNQVSARLPSAPGSGGYAGGLGGMVGGSAAQPGNGPAGGAAATTTSAGGSPGGFSGNQFVTPLVGGSGGGGGLNSSGNFGGVGGAGGGALLIASSSRIHFICSGGCGQINADGGIGGGGDSCGTCGGAGAGGGVRLIAPIISSDGGNNVLARGARGNTPALNGKIRVESFSGNGANGTAPAPLTSTPDPVTLPATPPSTILVSSINGVTINANPFSFPDTTINSGSPVPVVIQAQYVPVGTVPKIYVISEAGPDLIVNCAAGLQGTLQQSSCTASITFPTGGSRGFVKAIW
jgi:hypothetical protein